MRAIVVDDSKAMRTLLKSVLRETGFEIAAEAENGQQALEALHQVGPVELMLLDWNMPVMNGFELLVEVRAQGRMTNMRMMMVTTETEASRNFASVGRRRRRIPDQAIQQAGHSGKIGIDGTAGMKIEKVRVLVVDDSALVRKIVTDTLNAEADMEVVGVAPNGKVALEKLEFLKPDIVLLDLEMPEMDGITTLKRLRKDHRQLPVVVFSTLSERGAQITLDALAAGATDYLCKPSGTGSLANSKGLLQGVLAPKLRSFAARRSAAAAPDKVPPRPAPAVVPNSLVAPARQTNNEPIELLCIGISAGGPPALAEVIPKLPRTLGVPVMIVQHMPPLFTKFLAERLAQTAALKVTEAADGMSVEAGTVYVARGGEHMKVVMRAGRACITLDSGELENGCRPAVDPLFRSAAAVYGKRLLTVVMTGMGSDGTNGAREVRKAGGRIWAQDEQSSAVWGMAGSIVRAGLADRVFKQSDLADDLARTIEASRRGAVGAARM
ncbi:MAG: chemotaxis-specific protein-glutamate methyltransferase CheB [Polyangiaceae bacterium]